MFRSTHATFEDIYNCIVTNGARSPPEDPRLPQAAWENGYGGLPSRLGGSGGGSTSIGRWDYQDVPLPTNDSLGAVGQQYLDYETDPAHTRDIYKAVIVDAPAGMDWVLCTLTEERRPDVTELTASNSIKLSKGYWEIKLHGSSSSVYTLQIARGNGHVIYQKLCPVGRFTDTHFAYVEAEIEIRMRARRNVGESTLNSELLIVLGRI